MTRSTRKTGNGPPEASGDATHGGTAPISGRRARLSALAAGRIADEVIAAARPNAPTLEIQRHVAERCRRARLPVPSRHSLIARIAYVRRHGTRDVPPFAHQITIDHCIVVAPDGACAAFSVAVLEPPGSVVSAMVRDRPHDAGVTAALIVDALKAMRDDGEPARIAARFGTDDGHAAIDGALDIAGVVRVGGSSDRRSSGRTARGVVSRSLTGGHRPLTRRPFGAAWMTEPQLDSLRKGLMKGRVARHGHDGRPYLLVHPARQAALSAELRAIAETGSGPSE